MSDNYFTHGYFYNQNERNQNGKLLYVSRQKGHIV